MFPGASEEAPVTRCVATPWLRTRPPAALNWRVHVKLEYATKGRGGHRLQQFRPRRARRDAGDPIFHACPLHFFCQCISAPDKERSLRGRHLSVTGESCPADPISSAILRFEIKRDTNVSNCDWTRGTDMKDKRILGMNLRGYKTK